MKYIFDQNLGEGLCIFTSFYFPESGLYLLNNFIYLFIVTKKKTQIKTIQVNTNLQKLSCNIIYYLPHNLFKK